MVDWQVYLNPGDGDFSLVTPYIVGTPDQRTESVTVVDLNNDGKNDIIAGNKNQRNKVYLNKGNNVFTTGIDLGTEEDDTTSVQVGLAVALTAGS